VGVAAAFTAPFLKISAAARMEEFWTSSFL